MKVIYRKAFKERPIEINMPMELDGVASTLLFSNTRHLLEGRVDPFRFLKGLKKDYGINARCRPLMKNRKINGYIFLRAI